MVPIKLLIKIFVVQSGVMSNITQDSGIHTMSSRRESAFSDGALQYLSPSINACYKKANSDCVPGNNYLANNCLGGSLDRFQNVYVQHHHETNTNEPPLSVFSQKVSCCDDHQVARISYCSNRFHSSDPGGGSFSQRRYNCSAVQSVSCSNRTVENRQCPPSYQQEKLKINGLEPLCAKRLLPTRHQTKNAILSILENREVCIEFIKRRGPYKKELVCEVCRISPDGLRIILYEPDGGRGVPPSTSPPPLPTVGTDQIFSFESLPEKHWKKYSYAAKFVDLVRAKTPKVTYYTDKAKCLLMENLTDFEACFHEGKLCMYENVKNFSTLDWRGYLHNFV